MELIAAAVIAALLGLLGAFAWRRRTPLARRCAGGAQEITIGVCGCFAPDRFRARRGVPLRIHFDRDDIAEHASRVFLPDFGLQQSLPAGRRTTVELVPDERGEFLFTSGDGVYSGVFRV